MAEAEKPDLTTLTVQLLSAYLANNTVPSGDIPGLIQSTRSALAGDVEPAKPEQPEFVPATTVRKSLSSREHIISLIDGRPYKSLKRHLSSNGLTPAEYRTRYDLPKDYPMVAPAYSERRREVAERLGLGRKKGDAAVPAAAPKTPPAEEAAAVAPAAGSPETAQAKATRTGKPRTRQAKAAAVEQAAPVLEKASTDTPVNGSDAVPASAEKVPVTKAKAKPKKKPAKRPSPTAAPKKTETKSGANAAAPRRRRAAPAVPHTAE